MARQNNNTRRTKSINISKKEVTQAAKTLASKGSSKAAKTEAAIILNELRKG